MARLIEKKCVISGDVVEVYEYEKGYLVESDAINPQGRGSEASEEDKAINRDKVSDRARKSVRRLINANIGQYGDDCTAKFLTLTFADHVTDPKTANYEFEKFIKRMNYVIFGSKRANLRYLAVIEFTKRGRIHYHVVLFNIPYIKAKELENIWSNGFIKVNKINHVDNVGAYVCKYMTKDNDKLVSKKSYFASRNLFKPDEITDKKRVANLVNSLPSGLITFESSFNNDYLGNIRYTQYNIKKED
jgi:hypothetical protein